MAIVYKLTFPNGKAYIGITRESLSRRIDRHISYARNGRNYAISKAIRKYGESSFKREILLIGSWQYVKELEIKAIALFKTFGAFGYNLTAGGEGTLGVSPTELTRNKISASLSGRKLSPEHKAKIGAAFKGKPWTENRRKA